MAVPKKVEQFVKRANNDAPPKPKREPKESDMPLIAFRVHADIEYTLEEYQLENRLTWSEFLRDTLMAGMRAKGIEIRPKPPKADS